MQSKRTKQSGARRPPRSGGLDRVLFSHAPKPIPRIKGPVIPRIEVKYVDTAVAGGDADTTGTILPLNLIAQGTDNTQRIGREAFMLAVNVRGKLVCKGTTSTTPQVARLLLVWDNATNGVLPAITDVLTSADSYGFPNVSNIGRFTILHDELFGLGVLTAALSEEVVHAVDLSLKINSSTRFGGTTAAIASNQDGTLLSICVGTIAAGTAAASFVLTSRVAFKDAD